MKKIILALSVIVILLLSLFAGYKIFFEKKEYYSCPCCCPSENTTKECIYHSKGDDIEKILERDKNMDCSLFGCGLPVIYKYCD